ncbi:MAG: (2Fe-2S)-binding protein [Burkholderiales bacterium]|nr:(2Fe-2S)-binding protein [Burkholderiales bacterium]
MYICICNAVTDNQIRNAAHGGCTRMRDLREQLGVAGDCGKCAPAAQAVLKASQAVAVNCAGDMSVCIPA